jgi:hypothetical protein
MEKWNKANVEENQARGKPMATINDLVVRISIYMSKVNLE